MEQEVVTPKSPSHIATELKREADKSKAFQDVCTVFAMRERTRGQVTVASLRATMLKEGYKYNSDTCQEVIARLAKLGVGKLHKNTKGKVTALTDVKYTLQSIGLAAVGDKLNLSPFRQQQRYPSLPGMEIKDSVSSVRAEAAKTPIQARDSAKTVLVSNLNGKQLEVPLTSDEYIQFLSELLNKRSQV